MSGSDDADQRDDEGAPRKATLANDLAEGRRGEQAGVQRKEGWQLPEGVAAKEH